MNKSLKVTIDNLDDVKAFIENNKKDSDVFYSILDETLKDRLSEIIESDFEEISENLDCEIAKKHISALFFSYSFFIIVIGKRILCSNSDSISYMEFLSLFEQLKK